MATFVVLGKWTDEGARAARDTVTRSEAVRAAAQRLGGDIKDIYWTMGRYDVIAICEATDDETAVALSATVSSAGMVRTETLRAFDADEVTGILSRLS